MKKNRVKFLAICGRVRDLKARYARQIEASVAGTDEPERRQIRRVAATVLLEGQWLARVCERKLLSNKHPITKSDEKKLNAAKEFFETALVENEETVAEHGFVEALDAEFVTHMDTAASMILRMDAEEDARRSKAIAAEGLEPLGDDDETAAAEEDETEDAAETVEG